jgi:hypothetical protein
MVHFDGRHRDVQYMPHKPIRYGFKIFILAESVTGYVLSYEPFSSSNQQSDITNSVQQPFVCSLNWRLAHHYENDGYIIHGDRYFSSAKTVIALQSKGI